MACSSVLVGCVVMLIEITTSGGFGGISAAGKQKNVDMGSVVEPVKSEICKAFDLKNLESIAGKADHAGAADGMSYKIVIVDDKEVRHEFNLAENLLPAEMLDMIDGF